MFRVKDRGSEECGSKSNKALIWISIPLFVEGEGYGDVDYQVNSQWDDGVQLEESCHDG